MIEVVVLAAIWLGLRFVAAHDRSLRIVERAVDIIERQSALRQRKRKTSRRRRVEAKATPPRLPRARRLPPPDPEQ